MALPTMRETMNAAIDSAESEETPAEAAPETPAAEETTAEASPAAELDATLEVMAADEPAKTVGDKPRGTKGKFVKAGAAQVVEAKGGEVPPVVKAPVAAAPKVDAPRPPQSWKAEAREEWAKVPPKVQQEILRLDQEVLKVMRDTAPVKKFQADFQAVAAPYLALIQAEGANTLKAFEDYLKTSVALRTSPPTHKTRLVEGLISQFSVPFDAQALVRVIKKSGVSIEDLDSALAGEQPKPGQQPQFDPSQYRDPRVDQVLAQIEEQKAAHADQIQRATASEISDFAKTHEFIGDVRKDMADFIDLAESRGVAISLQEAYDRALQLHPDIVGVLNQRAAATKVGTAKAATQKAREAASSVRTRPAGATTASAPKTIRGGIDSAIAQLSGHED